MAALQDRSMAAFYHFGLAVRGAWAKKGLDT